MTSLCSNHKNESNSAMLWSLKHVYLQFASMKTKITGCSDLHNLTCHFKPCDIQHHENSQYSKANKSSIIHSNIFYLNLNFKIWNLNFQILQSVCYNLYYMKITISSSPSILNKILLCDLEKQWFFANFTFAHFLVCSW